VRRFGRGCVSGGGGCVNGGGGFLVAMVACVNSGNVLEHLEGIDILGFE